VNPDVIEDALRLVGLYVDEIAALPEGSCGASSEVSIVVRAMVGDLAFSARVQDDAQASLDKQFRSLAAQFRTDEVHEAITELKEMLGEG
jgi:hypothetical protein